MTVLGSDRGEVPISVPCSVVTMYREVISVPEKVVGTAISGTRSASTTIFAMPIVDPPPMARTPSAWVSRAEPAARLTWRSGTCAAVSDHRPRYRFPSSWGSRLAAVPADAPATAITRRAPAD